MMNRIHTAGILSWLAITDNAVWSESGPQNNKRQCSSTVQRINSAADYLEMNQTSKGLHATNMKTGYQLLDI